jgi:hypothetical protein
MTNDTTTQTPRLFDLGRLHMKELLGMGSGLLLLATLWLPWFTTSRTDPFSQLAGASGGQSVSAWQTFSTVNWILVAVSLIPFALTWTLVRDIKITHNQGELTMILGLAGALVILCNGIILGRPHGAVDISLSYGYFAALLATLGVALAGYQRQAIYARITNARKPPGILH